MKNYILIMVLFIANSLNAQNILIINNHINETDKRDLNQQYINKKTKKIKELDSTCFLNGFIINKYDTMKCKIYLKNKRLNSDLYLYLIVKYDSSKNYFVYTPKDLSGFIIQNRVYLSHSTNLNNIISYSFIRLIDKGKVELYEREGTAENIEFTYLFKKIHLESLSVITPFSNNIRYYNESTTNDGSKYFSVSTNLIDEKFKIAFKDYFIDCPDVSGKVISGYYKILDFERIIQEYNKCK